MIKAKYIERIENDKNILEEDRIKLLEEAYQIQENAINRNSEFLNSNIEYHPCVKEFLLGASYRYALESYNDGKITSPEHLKKELNRLNIPLRTEEEYNNWVMLVRHVNKAHNKYANYQPAYDFYQKHINIVKQTKEPKEIFEDLKRIDKNKVISFITLNKFLNISATEPKKEDVALYLDKHFKNKILRLWDNAENIISYNELIEIMSHECYISKNNIKWYICKKLKLKTSQERANAVRRRKSCDLVKNTDYIIKINAEKAIKQSHYKNAKNIYKEYLTNYLTNLEKMAQEIKDETGIDICARQLEKQIGQLPNYKKRNRVSEKKFLLCLRDIFKNTKIIVNDRDLIKPLELDFVVPKFKLAIEYNGGKFHEDKFLLAAHNMTALEYHSLKREKAKEQGLDLIFVWDDIFYERPLDIINLLEAKDFTNPLLNQLEAPQIESRLLLDEE